VNVSEKGENKHDVLGLETPLTEEQQDFQIRPLFLLQPWV
jgi:hypothetical protein